MCNAFLDETHVCLGHIHVDKLIDEYFVIRFKFDAFLDIFYCIVVQVSFYWFNFNLDKELVYLLFIGLSHCYATKCFLQFLLFVGIFFSLDWLFCIHCCIAPS
jgi:hypothetical protein